MGHCREIPEHACPLRAAYSGACWIRAPTRFFSDSHERGRATNTVGGKNVSRVPHPQVSPRDARWHQDIDSVVGRVGHSHQTGACAASATKGVIKWFS